jgi:cytochrome-b5 reductase
MTAGGTGITPMFQLIQAALLNNDNLDITLIFGNRSEDDILLKKELDEFAFKYPAKFKLIYIIDKAIDPSSWNGHTGYITKELIEK